MNGTLGRHFLDPIAAVRPFLFVRLLYLLLAVDLWVNFVGRGPSYGADGFNVAHFAWLDAIGPMPTASLYAGMMVLISFGALAVAIVDQNRPLMIMVCALFTYAWAMSRLDNYQHHYFLSLVLFLSIFLPKVTAADAVRTTPEGGKGKPAGVVAWAYAVIGVQVAILYLYAAISKMDSRWIAGAVVGNLSSTTDTPSTQAVPLLGAMLGEKVWPVLSVVTIILELLLVAGYALAVRRDRSDSRWWAGAMWLCWLMAMGMHVGIELFHLRIGLFSYYMIALACVFLLPAGVLLPVARWMAGLSAAVTRWLERGTGQSVHWRIWIIVAIVCAIALPVIIINLDLPYTTAGLIAAGVLSLALFTYAAVQGRRIEACGYVLVTALYLALATGFTLGTNLRSDIHLSMAQYSQLGGDYERAISQYEAARKFRVKIGGPDQNLFAVRLAVNLGDAHQLAGRTKEAEALFKQAIVLDPANVGARMNLAGLHLAQGRPADAAELFIQVIELEPAHAVARYNLGVILLTNRRLAPAIAQFEAAVAADPGLVEAHNNLANAHIMSRNHAAAVAPLRQVLKYQPDSIDALNNLAIILSTTTDPKLRDMDEALRLAQRAVQLSQRKQVDILGTLVSIYSALGRHDEAQALLDEMAILRQR